jgi:hypothetical protein
MQNRERARLVKEKEGNFLLAYFGKDSTTRHQRGASAIAAGYSAARAVWNANRVLDKYADLSFRECAETIGVTKPQMAVAFREFMQDCKGKDRLQGFRLLLANMGEATDNAMSKQATVINGPVMVIVGATEERMRALCRGSDPVPQLPAERDVIDLEPVEADEMIPPPAEETRPSERAPKPRASDFTGRNQGDVGK